MHSIRLDVEPMPAPRPRVRLAGKIPMAYYPSAYNNWRKAVAALIAEQMDREKIPAFIGPVAVTLRVRATKPRTSKLQYPKADSDNYAKALLDACTAAGLWLDDSQVLNLAVFKRWVRPGEPRVVIEVAALEAQP